MPVIRTKPDANLVNTMRDAAVETIVRSMFDLTIMDRLIDAHFGKDDPSLAIIGQNEAGKNVDHEDVRIYSR